MLTLNHSEPLSLALGTKDSLLDQGTVGKIQDLMAKKTEVPHEIRVSWSILGLRFVLIDPG